MRRPRGAGRLLAGIVVAPLLLATLFPFLWMVSAALRPGAELVNGTPPLLPGTFTTENFARLLAMCPMARFLLNSLVYALGTTALALLLNGLAAYAFACMEFPGRERLFALLLVTMMVPVQVTLVPMFLILRQAGLLNSMLGLILPGGASVVGIFLLRQFMREIPRELLDQARIDGCSEWALFSRVVLPLSRPVFASLAVFTFVGTWNEFLGPLIVMMQESSYPLPVALATLAGEFGSETGLMMAGAVLTVLPSLAVFLAAQRHYLRNITAGAIR